MALPSFFLSPRGRRVGRVLAFVAILGGLKLLMDAGLHAALDPGLLRSTLSRVEVLVATLFALYVVTRHVEGSSFEAYGLKVDRRWLSELAVGCAIAVAQLGLYLTIMRATGNLEMTVAFAAGSPDDTFAQGFVAEIFRQLSAGIAEEIVFRAFIFYVIFEAFAARIADPTRRAYGVAFFAASFFGLAHLSNDGASAFTVATLWFDGFMMSLPFLITGRLGMCIGMHFAWNLTQGAVLGLPNSGEIAKASIFVSTLPDTLLTGGEFGPEGSILLFALDAAAVLAIVGWKALQGYDRWLSPSILRRSEEPGG